MRRPNSGRACSTRSASRLEAGRIVLHRANGAVEFPARFQLVLATNPCPCGAPQGHRLQVRLRDAAALSTPVVRPVAGPDRPADPDRSGVAGRSDGRRGRRRAECTVAARVLAARAAAARAMGRRSAGERMPRCPVRYCARGDGARIGDALAALDDELERGRLSARGCDRVLKLAWTLADLGGAGRTRHGRGHRGDRTAYRLATGGGGMTAPATGAGRAERRRNCWPPPT